MPYKDRAKRLASARASYQRLKATLTPLELSFRLKCMPCRSPLSRRKEHLKSRYGITLEQWEALFEKQGCCCAICGSTEPRWKRGWHTDHEHGTNKIRGILCHFCNRTVGNYDVAHFQAFIDYLKPPTVIGHKGRRREWINNDDNGLPPAVTLLYDS